MSRTDTEIHQIELLLTLDYLLNYTDKDNPASQQDICRHAKDFNLKYDPNATKGNDVRRQRIGECLQFLQSISYKFKDTDKIPFVVNSTDTGKFYIEEKNHLNKDQIINILAAVKNDKYLKNDDTDDLIDKLLNSLCNKNNKELYKEELEKKNKRVIKYRNVLNRKIKLIQKAYEEKKCILILNTCWRPVCGEKIVDGKRVIDIHSIFTRVVDEEVYCRVYRIEEHNNKPYVILLPLNQDKIIFDAIDNLNIPTELSERKLLLDDEENDNRLEDLFESNNPALAEKYHSLDEYIEKSIRPEGGFVYKSSFYFRYRYINQVKKSFEEYFSCEMPYVRCRRFTIDDKYLKHRKFSVDENKLQPFENLRSLIQDEYAIKSETLEGIDSPHGFFAVVNIEVSKNALVSWLENNPSIAKVVDVVSPRSVNEEVGEYYLSVLLRYQHTLGRDKIIDRMNKSGIDDYLLKRDYLCQQTKKKDSLVFPRKKKDDKKNQR